MKKLVLAAAIGSTLAIPAFAQSTVTLYGIIDTGVTYVNNAGKNVGGVVAMQSGVEQGSRWGLKGTEDLGGGLKTVFQIENGFNVNTGKLGQGGLEFGRQAYVGLSSATFGTITLGRQYDSVVDFIQPATMNGTWGALFSHAGDIDNSDNGFRVNNTIKYTSNTYGGLQFGGLYALGGVAGSATANSTFSAGVSYTNGPVYLGGAYFSAKNPATQFADGNFATAAPQPTNLNPVSTNGAFGYVGAPTSMQVAGLGGTYTIGKALIGADYTNTRFGNAYGTASSVTFNNYEVWGQYSVTPATTLATGFTYTQGKVNYLSNNNSPKYGQLNFLADYALSKRTDVYLNAVYEKAWGGASADIYDGFPAGQSSNTNQVLARVGIRAKF
jgi:predicted porin